MVKPDLPPAYDLVVIAGEGDAFTRACELGRERVRDGLLVWNERRDRLQLALLLEPETSLAESLQALLVFTLATGDALGGFTAPALPLALRWPATVLIDGIELLRVRCAWEESDGAGAIPRWLVLGFDVPMYEPPEPGRTPDRLTIEGAAGEPVPPAAIVERFARLFLLWLDRWQGEGMAPIVRAWNQRLEGRGRVCRVRFGGIEAAGIVEGLDEEGRLVVGGRRLTLVRLGPAVLA